MKSSLVALFIVLANVGSALGDSANPLPPIQENDFYQSCISQIPLHTPRVQLNCLSHQSNESGFEAQYQLESTNDSNPLGVIRLSITVDRSKYLSNIRILWIEVLEEHQNQGIATSVLQLLKAQVDQKKVRSLQVSVNESDEAALHLYLKSGFQEDESQPAELLQLSYF